MKRLRRGSPISRQYWRASLSAASTASAAENEVDPVHAGGRLGDQRVGERLGRLAREEAGMGIGQPVGLILDGLDHGRVAVAEAGDGGTARGVEVAPSLLVDDMGAVTPDRYGIGLAEVAVKDVGQGVPLQGPGHPPGAAQRSR
jgi:hypothetical protein